MKTMELWQLSSYIHKESFFQAQVKSVGIQKNKFLERYQKNMANSKRSYLYTNLVSSLFLLMYAVLPIITLMNISKTSISSANINNELFSIAFIFATYYVINFIYYFMIGFLSMMEFLTGKTFKYLRSLPMDSSDIRMITIFTVMRMNGMQIAVIIFTVPVAILFLMKNILLVAIILLANLFNALFMFYLFLVVSNYLSNNVFNSSKTSKLYTVIRLSVSVIYIVSILAVSYIIQFIPYFTNFNILSNNFSTSQTLTLNIVCSLIFFPLTSGYIISLVYLPINLISNQVLLTSLFAFLIFALIIFLLLRKGNGILSNLAYESKISSNQSKNTIISPDQVKVSLSSPKIAYIKRIFIMASREQGKLILLLMPIILPIITALSIRTTSSGSSVIFEDPFSSFFIFLLIIPFFLNNALTEAEEGLGGLLSTLPINNREIFRSKQYIMTFLLLLSAVIYTLIVSKSIPFQFINSLIQLFFLSFIIPIVYLLLVSYLFGKLNNRYTLFKINSDNSLMKYIILISSTIILLLIETVGINILYIVLKINIITFSMFLIVVNLLLWILADFSVRIMIKS